MKDQTDLTTQSLAVEVAVLPAEPVLYPPSGLRERYESRRHAQHDSLLQTLQSEMRSIARMTEQSHSSLLASLREILTASHSQMREMLNSLDPQKVTAPQLSLEQYRNAETAISAQAAFRRERIEKAMEDVDAVESVRVAKVADVFNRIKINMIAKSHLNPDDVGDLMEQELVIVNDVLLRNRTVFVEVFKRMLTENVYSEKRDCARLGLFRKEWTEALAAHYVEDGLQVLEKAISKVIGSSRSSLANWERRLKGQQVEFVQSLEDVMRLIPPDLSMEKCKEWLNKALGALETFYEDFAQGVDSIRKQCFDAATSTSRSILKRSKPLPDSLSVSHDFIRVNLIDVYLHRSARYLSRVNNDLQFYVHAIMLKKNDQITAMRDLFAFVHGIAWHWELHCSGVAKAEDLLDTQLQKQRMALNTAVDAKINPKIQSTLDSLRYVNVMTAATALTNALQASYNETDKAVSEAGKKMAKLVGGYETIMTILLRGYQKRVYAYMQVSAKPVESDVIIAEDGTQSLPQTDPLADLSSGNRRLPDIPVSANERRLLKELGLTLADEENIGLRLKLLPPFQDDPRGNPPTDDIVTRKGITFVPAPVSLQQSQRFPKEKDTGKKEPDPRMTESQLEILNEVVDLPVHSGLISLDEYMANAPEEQVNKIFEDVRERMRVAVLTHASDNWSDEFRQRSMGWLDAKRELCEAEMKMRMQAASLRWHTLQDTIVATREKELTEHDASYKQREAELAKIVAWAKEEIAVVGNESTEKCAPMKDRMSSLEKTFFTASRADQIVQIQGQIKDDAVPFYALLSGVYSTLKAKITERIQLLLVDCKSVLSTVQNRNFPMVGLTRRKNTNNTRSSTKS